jgi:hypothetical protein
MTIDQANVALDKTLQDVAGIQELVQDFRTNKCAVLLENQLKQCTEIKDQLEALSASISTHRAQMAERLVEQSASITLLSTQD